jgi:acyl-CoA thioesterase
MRDSASNRYSLSDSPPGEFTSMMEKSSIYPKGLNRFADLVGLRFTACGEGRCSAEVDVREDLFHPGGIVHGGVAFALADSTMATGLLATLEGAQIASTIELKISFLAPVREGIMLAESWIVKRGRRIAFAEAKVTCGDTLVATATATFAIVDKKQ